MFQSSPGPKARCNPPAPPKPPVAIVVSILTGPEGPVQRYHTGEAGTSPTKFQSSPGPKARCNGPLFHRIPHLMEFQSSPGPKARCNLAKSSLTRTSLSVSILTGPEGPVQPAVPAGTLKGGPSFNPHRARRPGATCRLRSRWPHPAEFQSSPGPKARCNSRVVYHKMMEPQFQSSPGPKARCNLHAHESVGDCTFCFNPHRARRPGATSVEVPPSDCLRGVSILTGPEGPVQPWGGFRP